VLLDLFKARGVDVRSPSGMPTGLCYAMFTGGSIGIIDRQSLMNITGEAWVRNPTTIVKKLRGELGNGPLNSWHLTNTHHGGAASSDRRLDRGPRA
jgi:hypothetical protein